jgi:hypothetical protein
MAGEQRASVVIENDCLRYVIGADGRNLNVIDKRTGRDYCAREPQHTFVSLRKGGKNYLPCACSFAGGKVTVEFKEAGVTVVIKVSLCRGYVTFEVASVEGEGVEELTLSNLHLTISEHIGTVANVAWNEQFAVGVMALNLQANARGGSAEKAVLWSACYPKFGLAGAKIGLIGCPTPRFRSTVQEMVRREGVVHSEVGGAWALDAEENKGSYLFASVSERDVDQWITIANTAGIKELLLQGLGKCGHYDPDPARFPHGLAGVRAVVDKIHAAGLKAGWHMMSNRIQQTDSWVSPTPDQRLAKRATLTLAERLSGDATFVPTVESPKDLPTQSGFWFRGSMDVLVDDEIVSYSGLCTSSPYGLTGCRRGAHGTKAAAHEKGVKVYNLDQLDGMYLPDGDSTLMDEMARHIAHIANTCGFDMVYFDGLDGGSYWGTPWEWHYAAKFPLSVFRHIKRRVRVEASWWLHHTWHIHSRLGAWDHPVRDPKKFLDIHCAGNKSCLDNLLPTQLGWWALRNYTGPSGLATTPDVIEYLGSKCIGYDVPFSLQNVTPAEVRQNPNWPGLLSIMGRYEALRLGGYFPEPVKAKLRVPGDEFALVKSKDGKWRFLPVERAEYKVTGLEGGNNTWKVTNRFGAQQPRFRIQALMSAAPYDAPVNLVLADFADSSQFAVKSAAPGMSHRLESSAAQVKVGKVSGRYTATSNLPDRRGSWVTVGKSFSPWLNMAQRPALGVWVLGDGKGEVLNLQLIDNRGPGPAVGEHYVSIDFTGWRYFELVEPEGKRWSDYAWPYGHPYAIYRETVNPAQIASLNLYYNNVPPKQTASCYLSPIKALAIQKVKLDKPRLTIGGKTIVFPVALESGCSVQFNSPADCKLHDPNGVLLREVKPEGEVPTLAAGDNQITFACDGPLGYSARAIVTVTTASAEPLMP